MFVKSSTKQCRKHTHRDTRACIRRIISRDAYIHPSASAANVYHCDKTYSKRTLKKEKKILMAR